ncbi:TadE/TadG family type IV pilus assembly protein [Cognatishimia activa]|uniref:Flp pilus assembly protein TadG n=1 Tax=Cognatishimia activa TaxID=1715691 RepID=A0A0P1IMV1_9RHOB|nr:hypothetical protein [Cognatishimia activa]CUJ14586.1 hypothetical protein TA5113_02438 [Cognatishimia activa]CUK24999.1 hypothetical protein TA5114_00789 [Cognatishimia activa]
MTYAIKKTLGRFRRSEDGTLAFDFVLWFPFFLFLMLMGIEAGLVGLKHVKLERSLDQTVRWVRLNTGASPTHDDLKQMICSTNPVSDCMQNVQLEMRSMDLRNWQDLPSEYQCVDRAEEVAPMNELSLGMDNELMVMRVCAEYLSIMPGSGLFNKYIGSDSMTASAGNYGRILKTTAFVQEPR